MTTTTPRAALVRTIVGLLTAATLVALPVRQAAGVDDRADRWAGFRIPSEAQPRRLPCGRPHQRPPGAQGPLPP